MRNLLKYYTFIFYLFTLLLVVNPLTITAQEGEEFKPCTGPACNPSHRNNRKDAKFVPHKKKQVNVKHIRKQQIAKAKYFQAQQKKHFKLQQKLQSARQKNPRKFHRILDKAQNPYRIKHYKPRNLDNVTFANTPKNRKKGLDNVNIPQYRVRHQLLDNKKFTGNYFKKSHRSLDRQRYNRYKVNHRNLDSRRYASYQPKHRSLDRQRYNRYKVNHRNLDSRRYASYELKHHQRDLKTMRFYSVRHQKLDRRRMATYHVRHKNVDNRRIYIKKQRDRDLAFKVDKPTRVAKQYSQKIKKGLVVIPSAGYVVLKRNAQNFKSIKHKQFDSVTMPRYKVTHRGLDGISPIRLKIKHQNLDFVAMPQYKQRRLNPQNFCYPKLVVPHRNLDNVCYPKLVIPHKQLDFACGERSFRVKHKQLDNVCYKSLKICHRPLGKYKVPCDPNIVQPKTNLERVGADLKYIFTNKKRFCKLNSIYSGVSAGQIVETEKYGKSIVTDYIVKNRLIQYVRYVNGDSTKIKVKYRKSPSIKHLVVLVPRDEKKLRKSNGDPNLKKVKLSQKETKEIMMKHLVEKKNFVWLIRMYPEEEQNLPELYAKYGGYKEIKHPAFQKK